MASIGEDRAGAHGPGWLLAVCLALAGAGCGQRISAVEAPEAQVAPVQAALRVRVEPVTRGPLGRASELSGVVSPFRAASVAAEVAGRVLERHVEPGAAVEAGEPLLSLEAAHLDAAVEEARAILSSREVDLAEAKRELARGDELFSKGAVSEGRRDTLRFGVQRALSARTLAAAALDSALESQADAVVRAPFDGTVESVAVHVGDYLAPGAPVAMVTDFARVRVRAGATAAEAAGLAPGTRAVISLAALGGLRREAEVHSVGRISDPTTGTYPVELWLENPEGRLRAGMVGRVGLAEDAGEAVLQVPRAALVRRGGALTVFVIDGEKDGAPAASARSIQVGRQGEASVELLGGVREGELVVVDGQFALSDGTPVLIDAEAGERAAWND